MKLQLFHVKNKPATIGNRRGQNVKNKNVNLKKKKENGQLCFLWSRSAVYMGHGTHWNLVCLLGNAKSNVSLQLTFPYTHMPLLATCLFADLFDLRVDDDTTQKVNKPNKAANGRQGKLNNYSGCNNNNKSNNNNNKDEEREQELKQHQIGNSIFPFINQKTNRKKKQNL